MNILGGAKVKMTDLDSDKCPYYNHRDSGNSMAQYSF